MNGTPWRAIGFAIGAVALMAFGASPSEAQERFRLKMQTAVPSTGPHAVLLKRFADNLDRMSGGRLKVEVLPAGAVVGPQEIADAVSKGLVDMGYAWTHYWTGKHPASGLFSAPMSGAGTGLDQMGHLAWMMQGEGKELYRKLYQDVLKLNVVAFQVIPDGPEALGWFKKPITSLEEFRKIKFRTPPGLPGQVYTQMGVSVTGLPGPEIIPAAERGVIDAGEWVNPASDLDMGFHEIFKYYSLQGLHQAIDVGDIIINGTLWKKLPPDLQAIVEVATKASVIESLTYFVAENSKALDVLINKHKVQLFTPPADYPPAFLKAANTVLKGYEDKDPFFKEVVQSMRGFANTAVPYRIETLKQSLFMGEAGVQVSKQK
jgi:TRAP-type mannitol/chloroaromatic compound transport system substrate-binding protein